VRARPAGAAAAALLAACALASAAQAREEVRFGLSVGDNPVFAPVAAAAELGFFEERGLAVRIVPLRGSAAAEEALAAGHVDVIDHTIPYAGRAIAAGADLRIVATATHGFYGWSVIVRTESPAQKASDLAGKRIGVGPRLSVADMASQRLSDSTGVRYDFLTRGPGALVPDLRAGELDAVLYSAAVAQREVANGNARVLVDLADGSDRTAIYGYSAGADIRNARPTQLRDFLAATHRAVAHMKADRPWTIRFLRSYVNASDQALTERLYEQVIARLSETGLSDAEAVRRGLALAARAWNAPALAELAPTTVFTNAFTEPAP
jgi:NitT/TauT family transport system substrate-binding protein